MSTEINPIVALSEAFNTLQSENEDLRESMADIRARLAGEDEGWALISSWDSGDHLEGLDLDEVQEIAARLAPRVVAGALPHRAVSLHAGYVWGRGGCYIEGTEKPSGRGAPTALRKIFIDTNNQEAVFSDIAHEELQKSRFVEGNVLAAVNTRTKKINRIPFNQIKGIKVDPDFPENIIAYKREWDTQDGTTTSVKRRWYYTKRFSGTRRGTISDGKGTGTSTPVDRDVTIVDLRAGRQPGFVLGIPDGLPGLAWAEAYANATKIGITVTESLAKILFRVTSKTKQGVQSTGVKVANFGGHGGTASMAEGQELSAVSTAGRGYDHDTNRAIAAMAAAAWNVSTVELLADSSAAGSSYGAGSLLSLPTRNAMALMQREWADFYKDIFEVLGENRPTIIFEPFEAPDKYRELQAITLGSIALSDQEYRMAVLDGLDIVGKSSEIPETLKLRSQPENTAAQQSAPDQGVSNSTGGGGQGSNDLRNDSISSSEAMRREMHNDEFLDRLSNLVERMEAVSPNI